MPIKTFVQLATKLIAQIEKCPESAILPVWCETGNITSDRGRFSIKGSEAQYEVAYNVSNDTFNYIRLRIDKSDSIKRRKVINPTIIA